MKEKVFKLQREGDFCVCTNVPSLQAPVILGEEEEIVGIPKNCGRKGR